MSAPTRLRSSPHLHAPWSVQIIMRNVAFSLMPVCLWSIYAFGISSFALIVVTVLSCMATEEISCRMSGRPSTIGDYSAIITGLLLALTLPPGFPVWMAAVAGYPHATVPMGTVHGVPLGVSFIGARDDDARVLAAATSRPCRT